MHLVGHDLQFYYRCTDIRTSSLLGNLYEYKRKQILHQKHRINTDQWGYAVDWDTALQVGRSRVPFLMAVIGIFNWFKPSSHTRTSGIGLDYDRNEYQGCLLGVKATGSYGWQLYHLHMPIFWKIWESETPEDLRDCSGPWRVSF